MRGKLGSYHLLPFTQEGSAWVDCEHAAESKDDCEVQDTMGNWK